MFPNACLYEKPKNFKEKHLVRSVWGRKSKFLLFRGYNLKVFTFL